MKNRLLTGSKTAGLSGVAAFIDPDTISKPGTHTQTAAENRFFENSAMALSQNMDFPPTCFNVFAQAPSRHSSLILAFYMARGDIGRLYRNCYMALVVKIWHLSNVGMSAIPGQRPEGERR